MKDEAGIKDWRSTGRRRGRKTLYKAWVSYECVDCGVTSAIPPKDAPEWFSEIWPFQKKLVEGKLIKSQLQADHETKDVTINEIGYINWRCPACHKIRDSQTEKGTSTQTSQIYF